MGETDAIMKQAAVQAYNDAQLGGLVLTPFGDISSFYIYNPIMEKIKVRRLVLDEKGNLIQDPETGAYGFIGNEIEQDYLTDVKVEERQLPIKNFFSLGIPSSILTDDDKRLVRKIMFCAGTQVELLTLDIQKGKTEEVNDRIALLNKLYFLLGNFADTSKGSQGEMAHLVKTKFEHNLSDIRQRQSLREEKDKGIFGGIRNPFARKGKKELKML